MNFICNGNQQATIKVTVLLSHQVTEVMWKILFDMDVISFIQLQQ